MNKVARLLYGNHTIALHCIALLGHARLGKDFVVVWLTVRISCLWTYFLAAFCLFNLFVFDRVIRIAIIGSYMVEICPTPYSAATEPRASFVRLPHDGATGCALVLKCMWMKLHHQFFLYRLWDYFPLLLLLKGVGSWGSNNVDDLFYVWIIRVHSLLTCIAP